MSAPFNLRSNLAILEQCILNKGGLFLTPMVSALLAAKVWPPALLVFFPGLLMAVIYRTVRIPGNKLKVFGASFGIVIFSYILVRTFCLEVRYVVGEGMSPTLANGARVLVDKTVYWWPGSPQRGDIIIARLNILQDLRTEVIHIMDRQDVKISRVYRLPGEMVVVRDDDKYVNVQVGDSPKRCLRHDTDHPAEKIDPLNSTRRPQNPLARGIRSECFFLFQDDNPSSKKYDGWAVPQKSIVGKVTAVLWSP